MVSDIPLTTTTNLVNVLSLHYSLLIWILTRDILFAIKYGYFYSRAGH
jgi:hypothetical protein